MRLAAEIKAAQRDAAMASAASVITEGQLS